jgi:hypothetical protein
VSTAETRVLVHTTKPAPASESRLRAALQTTGLVVAPVTLLTALLYYFGWGSSKAAWMYFGVDQSVIGFSTQDYILRAVRPLFWPLSVLVVVALGALETDAEIDRQLQARLHWKAVRRLPAVLGSVGLVILAIACARRVGFHAFGNEPILTPVLFGLGAGTLSYAAQFRTRVLVAEGRATPPEARSPRSRSLASLKFSLAWALLILSGFWALSAWASEQGGRTAVLLARNLGMQPGVVIHSKQALAIDGPGVQVDISKGADDAYHYTYSGLRLLVRSGGRFFLVPDGWAPHTALAFVVPESDGIRVDFATP